MARALIKWPGGKTGELEKILPLFPQDYDRYVEPFFGGGAVYFALEPRRAVINDISKGLMEFYALVKKQDPELLKFLNCFEESFGNIQIVADSRYAGLYEHYKKLYAGELTEDEFTGLIVDVIEECFPDIMRGFSADLIKNKENFKSELIANVSDKLIRTCAHEKKAAITDADRVDNFTTGFTSGYYMYFRDVYNDICLNRGPLYGGSYEAAVYYFVREYCYGSMFRYNRKGEFNIPYGGISYNRKNLRLKIDNIFNADIEKLFSGTDIYAQDFENFCRNVKLSERDFMFLDPPYDTDFSDYEGREFAKQDHERLAGYLTEIPAKFLLVIKNTEFIYNLYKDRFNISTFDNRYTYNVKSRNDRKAEHLVITNY